MNVFHPCVQFTALPYMRQVIFILQFVSRTLYKALGILLTL